MSADFPNRSDWLKIRATPRKLTGHDFLHVSKWSTPVKLPNGTETLVWHHRTFEHGVNREKRRVGKGWHRTGLAMVKTNTTARTNLLSDRRLRQRSY